MPNFFLPALGIINALGNNRDEVVSRLFPGDTAGLRAEEGWLSGRAVHVGRVQAVLPDIPEALSPYACRNNRLLLAALSQIQPTVDAVLERYGRARVGIVLGSSTSGTDEAEKAIAAYQETGKMPAHYYYSQQELGGPAVFLAHYLGITGPAYCISTACTSSAKAMIAARSLLRCGICDAVLTGGSDSLCKLTINGFGALELLSNSICNPMSRNRDGINIGEGAALFMMTREPLHDGAEFMLYGAGESSDAYHMSTPHPEGVGAELAIRAALDDAGFAKEEIDYLNMHATATPKNDAMESLVIHRIFPQGVPVSGTKPMTGHTLGAAGATELALCFLAMQTGCLPPHLWDGELDNELPELDLVQKGSRFSRGTNRLCMSSSFAFGGNNTCLLIGDAR